MRISDWSSDVCSSDLDEDIQTALALENLFGHHAPPVFIRHVVPDKARALTQLACIGLALGGSVGQNHVAALFDEQLGDRSPYSGKIGRAACREGVCQSV